MKTECNSQRLLFQWHGAREVTASFDGGAITSDAGGLLLREVDQRFGILREFAGAFTDHRDPELTEFSTLELLTQRVMGIARGYEDLNDHEQLRHDPLLALLAGRRDVTGSDRRDPRDRGVPLAGKSTLNRLELTPVGASADSRYKKIVASIAALQDALVDVFIRLKAKQGVPTELVLDLDATDDPVHGDQLGKFFHGYYKSHCYLPLYTFCGDWPLGAVLRPADIDGCAGTVQELSRIVPKLRAAWPNARIIVRADSGFCRDAILSWCEENKVDYIIGLSKNTRLTKLIGGKLHQANQLRLLFSTMAYVLHVALREFSLAGTEMPRAQAGTIRTKLLKIGRRIKVSVRRVWISISESYPHQRLFERILENIRRQSPLQV